MKHGLKPTQLSKVLKERFKLEGAREPYDVIILDKKDMQGIRIQGKPKAAMEVLNIIKEHFKDAIVRRFKPQLNAIYLAKVKDVLSEGKYLIDLGECLGTLKCEDYLHEGSKVLVSVSRPSLTGECELSKDIIIVGRCVKLIKGGTITISKHIRDEDKRLELLSLAYSICPKGWGLRWRSNAEFVNLEDLINEVEALKKEAENIEAMLNNESIKAPSLLREGEELIEVEFPLSCKIIADDFRNEVTPTIKGHHFFKAWGKEISLIVDFAESLISEGLSRELISKLTSRFLKGLRLKEGDTVRFEHVKLNGEVLELTPGKVISIEDEIVLIKRIFRGRGLYDGLEIEKTPGDYAETWVAEGCNVIAHIYHRKNGEYIGEYYNISTPIEIYPYRIRYVDLAVDVIKKNDEVKVIDMAELQKAVDLGIISSNLHNEITKLVQFLVKALRSGYSGKDLIEQLLVTRSNN